jgi:L-asparaginase
MRMGSLIDQMLKEIPLCGLVVEGAAPYGNMTSRARQRLVQRAVRSGIPAVVVGRGNTEGFAVPREGLIAGSNLTATKARLLLMACLLRFGSLPPAKNPDNPTREEIGATGEKLKLFQEIFDTH